VTKERLLRVGKVVGAHGLRGEVLVHSFTEDPEALFTYEPLTNSSGEKVFRLQVKGVAQDHFIVSVDGVKDRNAAEAMKGVQFFVSRSSLPEVEEGVFYEADLIGLVARTVEGQEVGKVEALHDHGAGAFLEILPPHAKSFMLPFKDAFVPTVDLEGGFILVVIPEGWLSEKKTADKESGEEGK